MQSLVYNENIFREKKQNRYFQLKEKFENFYVANRTDLKENLQKVLQTKGRLNRRKLEMLGRKEELKKWYISR